jgi:hypothetical protein
MVARANTIADPVVVVSHQTRANWTSSLPRSEKTCPVQMAKNGRIEIDLVDRADAIADMIPLLGRICVLPMRASLIAV